MRSEETILKLLAVEPETVRNMEEQCGWPAGEVKAAVNSLWSKGQVTWTNGNLKQTMSATTAGLKRIGK
jgi:hypothetical protein